MSPGLETADVEQKSRFSEMSELWLIAQVLLMLFLVNCSIIKGVFSCGDVRVELWNLPDVII